MTWNCPSGLTWARIAPYPPGLTASPWQASVIKAYGSLSSGWWIKGSDIRIVFNSGYALSACSGRGPDLQGHSLLVSSVRGAVNCAKFHTCNLKKLHSPRNCLTSATSLGGWVAAIAFRWSVPGWTPSWLILNPKYSTSGKQNIDLGRLIVSRVFLAGWITDPRSSTAVHDPWCVPTDHRYEPVRSWAGGWQFPLVSGKIRLLQLVRLAKRSIRIDLFQVMWTPCTSCIRGSRTSARIQRLSLFLKIT